LKVLIVEDQEFKRTNLTTFLQKRNIDFEICEYLNDALRYIYKNTKDISGIILDLGLQSSRDYDDYSLYRGLDLVIELKRKRWDIPVLINSTTEVGILDEYPFIFGQRTIIESYEMLEKFITFLTQREEQ